MAVHEHEYKWEKIAFSEHHMMDLLQANVYKSLHKSETSLREILRCWLQSMTVYLMTFLTFLQRSRATFNAIIIQNHCITSFYLILNSIRGRNIKNIAIHPLQYSNYTNYNTFSSWLLRVTTKTVSMTNTFRGRSKGVFPQFCFFLNCQYLVLMKVNGPL